VRSPLRFPLLVAVVYALVAALTAAPARAQNRGVEAQARALQKKAMEEDYLTVDFDKATEKLNSALQKCGTDKCGAPLRATLKRDLATVQSAAGKKDDAIANLVEGLKIDPTLQLDPNFKTKELEALFAEAKKRAAGGTSGGTTPATGGAQPSGDFTHTPVPEQAVRTPVPVYAEYGGSEQLAKVVVKYKGFGMTEFKAVDLTKMGNGWGGTIPCADVQLGDLQYYLQGFNAANDPVATAGDRNNPYKVPIKKTIAGEAPHLPGQAAPTQCAETGECPPDFPGCPKTGAAGGVTTKGEGEDCEDDNQCTSGKCKDNKCTAPEEGATGGKPKLRRIWVGILGSWDFPLLGSANDVCKLHPSSPTDTTNNAEPINDGWYCVNSDGSDYPNRPPASGAQNTAIQLGKDDKVQGGLAPGSIRLMLSFDYAINYNILVGLRAGYVLNTYPGNAGSSDGKTFAPIDIEARGTYVLGPEGVAKRGLAPYLFIGGGATNVSANVSVNVSECPTGTTPPCGSPPTKSVNAWQLAGPGYVAVGGGGRLGLGPPKQAARAAILFGLKVMAAFGNGFLFIPSPEIGAQVGF